MKMKDGKGFIESGDTLSQIAKKNGMTLKALLGANPSIKNANQIKVGQTITMPPKAMQAGSASENPYKGMTRTQMNMLDQDTKANRKRLAAGKKRNRNSASNKLAESATRGMQTQSKAGAQMAPTKKNKNTGSSMSPKLQKIFKNNRDK